MRVPPCELRRVDRVSRVFTETVVSYLADPSTPCLVSTRMGIRGYYRREVTPTNPSEPPRNERKVDQMKMKVQRVLQLCKDRYESARLKRTKGQINSGK